jgi:hypothetical protein
MRHFEQSFSIQLHKTRILVVLIKFFDVKNLETKNNLAFYNTDSYKISNFKCGKPECLTIFASIILLKMLHAS